MNIKPGIKTTEFWIVLAFTALAVICNVILGDKCPIELKEAAIPISMYVVARGLIKTFAK